MKIAKLETLRIEEFPNLLWLSVHSDEGIVGLGETFLMPRTVEAYLHEVAAPKVLGRDPLAIDRIAKDLVGYLGFRSTGAEMRGNSALDIALWDLFGKAAGQPLAQLLGGFSRESIRTYNTCAGPVYMRKARGQQVANWGLTRESPVAMTISTPSSTAPTNWPRTSSSEGITAMKIWPFDPAAEKSDGQYISRPDLKSALEPFEKICRAVGDRMDVMVEFHSLWQLVPAMTIAKALAPFATFWHEDPIKMDSLASPHALCRGKPGADLRLGDAGLDICVPRSAGNGRGRRHHVRHRLVRRNFRGAQDRGDGRGVAPVGRAARLHGSGGFLRLDPSFAPCAERARPGKRARLLPDLVSRPCRRATRGEGRRDHRRRRPGTGSNCIRISPSVIRWRSDHGARRHMNERDSDDGQREENVHA